MPPKHILDLVPLPKLPRMSQPIENMADRIQAMQEKVRQKLEAINAKYKETVDKKRHEKKYGPFQITKKINNNAYVVALPQKMGISSTFNVANLYDYHPPNEPDSGNSGSSSFKWGGLM